MKRASPAPFLCMAYVLATLTWTSPGAAQDFTPVTDPQKTDVLVLRNGDRMTGDFRELQRGIVTLKTDAAATIYVKWPRVVTAETDKVFEIQLRSGRRLVGSMGAGSAPFRVRIRRARDTLDVPIDAVVEMVRIKKTFWERLDGSVDAGVDYTQQNSKLDISLAAEVRYDVAAGRFRLNFDGTLSRQDSVSRIERRNLQALYAHALGDRWFWVGAAGASRNSQLSLEHAWSAGTGPGRFLVLSNRVDLAAWLGLYYRTERYTDASARSTIPLSLVTDFQWFTWTGLSTDVSSELVVSPILNDEGRWQVDLTVNAKRELLSLLYLSVGIREYYDSRPPAGANRNDFSITTSLGWTF